MLSSSMLVGTIVGYGRRAYANCVSVGGGNFECSGASAAQSISSANAHVTALAGFSVTTASANALRITGTGDLSYTDANASSLSNTSGTGLSIQSTAGSAGSVTVNTTGAISASTFGITTTNAASGGALAITANGDITGTGTTARGIFAVNSAAATNLTIVTGGTVTGRSYGIFARNYGSGTTSVTANGDVSSVGTSGGLSGILARNSATGSTVTVNTAAGTTVTGVRYGIFALNSGTGALAITTAGDVTGTQDVGIYARHSAGGSIAITVDSTSRVTSSGTGASDAAISTVGGPATVTVAGTLSGGTGGALRFDQSSARADRLELRPGASITGNVMAGTGTDTLAFGGTGTASFDVATVGTGLQYQGFETFVKEGASSWTLTGTNTSIAGFTVSGGTLTVNGNMTSTAFTVNAGTLQGSSASLQANIVNNAAVVFDQATTGTYAGSISGSGSFTKQGAGTLILTGSNSYTGGTTVSAGSLQGNSASLQGNIVNNAAVVFDQATTGTYAGNISGNGSITKQGAGTLILTGSSSYTGGTTVSAGTLQGNATSLQGNIVNNAALVFNQVTTGTYAGNISGSGSVTKQGAGTLILTGSSSYTGGTTVSAGTLQGSAASLQGNIVNDATLVFEQTTDGTYAGNISGNGSLTKQGSGALNLTGASTYTGATTVSAGLLSVNGSLASSVSIGVGATLGGNATLGALTVNGGTLAPGNSIGTVIIGGNFVQNGGIYQVEVDSAGQGDRTNVGGTAVINGGAVQVLAQAGNYARNTTYTILNATGGVSGAYSAVTSNFAFLTPFLSYDANNVYLLLAQTSGAFAAGARSPNQYAVGAALDAANANATGDFNSVLNALSALDIVQGPAALDAISGQSYAGFGNAMIQGARLFMNNFSQQTGGGRRAGTGNSRRVALAEACDVGCDTTSPAPWGAWGGGMGGTGTIAGNGNTAAFTYNVGGFAAGLDRRIDDNLALGVVLGYQTGTQWTAGFGGRGTIDTFQAGLYANFDHGPLYVDALVGYAYSDNQMWRTIALPGLQPRTAQGRTGANELYGQIEAGYRFDLAAAHAAFVTPFARLQGVTAMQNAFTETGAQSLDLGVAAQTTNSLRSVLGTRLGGALDLGWRDKLAVQVQLGWSHEYADTARPVSASFAGAPTAPFTVYGAAPQRDGVVLGLSADTAIARGTNLYLRYEADISGENSSHAVIAGVRAAW
jgi:fibronectin-binding autotransporter adhesin